MTRDEALEKLKLEVKDGCPACGNKTFKINNTDRFNVKPRVAGVYMFCAQCEAVIGLEHHEQETYTVSP